MSKAYHGQLAGIDTVSYGAGGAVFTGVAEGNAAHPSIHD